VPNAYEGVAIAFGAAGNTVGGTTGDMATRNIISGNGTPGVGGSGVFINNNAAGNSVEGNFIGTDVSGSAALPNAYAGVAIAFSATRNTVGGTTADVRNIISGNGSDGVSINNRASDNVVQGNFLGTDVTGTQPLGNAFSGAAIIDSANNTVGGADAGAGNIISGNNASGGGVVLAGSGAMGNLVEGNLIGTDVTGTAALGNRTDGVFLLNGASRNVAGGTAPGARNVISGNAGRGVEIDLPETTGNVVQGNYIGADVTGTRPLGNLDQGVILGNTTGNTVGGTGWSTTATTTRPTRSSRRPSPTVAAPPSRARSPAPRIPPFRWNSSPTPSATLPVTARGNGTSVRRW
jgi:hypothetical protein